MSTPDTADLNDIRVLIIADDPLARAGLATLLAEQPGCVVVGQISYADTGQLDIYRPDVLLWDLGWDADAALEQPADFEDDGLPIVALLGEVGDAADALSTAAGAGLRGLLPRPW